MTLALAHLVQLGAQIALGLGAYAYHRVSDAYRYELRRNPVARCESIERRELRRMGPMATEAYGYFLSLPYSFQCAEWSP